MQAIAHTAKRRMHESREATRLARYSRNGSSSRYSQGYREAEMYGRRGVPWDALVTPKP